MQSFFAAFAINIAFLTVFAFLAVLLLGDRSFSKGVHFLRSFVFSLPIVVAEMYLLISFGLPGDAAGFLLAFILGIAVLKLRPLPSAGLAAAILIISKTGEYFAR